MKEKEENSTKKEIEKRSVNWILVLFYLYLHILGIAGMYFLFTKAKWITVFYREYTHIFYILLYRTTIEKSHMYK